MSQIIYPHIEYKEFGYSFFGRVYLEREYTFFALLGGGPRQNEIKPCFALRDIPPDVNPLTHRAFYLYVSDTETDRDRWISRREAQKWVERGDAEWRGEKLITDPDYFGASWLLTEELNIVYSEYLKQSTERLPCVEATIAAMRLLSEARIVYWFGN